MNPEGLESTPTYDKYGNYISEFLLEVKTIIQKLERIKNRINRQDILYISK